MKKSEMQVVIDYLLVQHDSLFECILNGFDEDGECRKDELVLRKFLLEAKEKGLNIERSSYTWERKIKALTELEVLNDSRC